MRKSRGDEALGGASHPSDVERVIGMVETLETLPDLYQLM